MRSPASVIQILMEENTAQEIRGDLPTRAYVDWLEDNALDDDEQNRDRWIEMETERILGVED